MRVASVNLSAGTIVPWRGKSIETGIFKEPVAGRVLVGPTGLEGDRQVDRRVHGGESKAVYAYAVEDYEWWSRQLGRQLSFGMFGENLTSEGLREREVHVGDVFRVGDAVLAAVQPRLPCYKLGIRFDDQGMIERFARSARLGIYFRVLEAGEIGAGDAISLVRRDPRGIELHGLVADALARIVAGHEDS